MCHRFRLPRCADAGAERVGVIQFACMSVCQSASWSDTVRRSFSSSSKQNEVFWKLFRVIGSRPIRFANVPLGEQWSRRLPRQGYTDELVLEGRRSSHTQTRTNGETNEKTSRPLRRSPGESIHDNEDDVRANLLRDAQPTQTSNQYMPAEQTRSHGCAFVRLTI